MSSSAKILISERQCFLTFSTRLFFLPRPFSRFTIARHRKLSRLLKGRRLARHRSAKGIFRVCLLFLHPLRRRPQKLKCKAIERWSALIPAFSFVPFVRGVSSRNWVELRESNANRIKLLGGKTRTIGAPSHYLVTRSIFVIELIFRALSISAKSFRELGAAYRRRGDTFTNVLSSLARPENSTFP